MKYFFVAITATLLSFNAASATTVTLVSHEVTSFGVLLAIYEGQTAPESFGTAEIGTIPGRGPVQWQLNGIGGSMLLPGTSSGFLFQGETFSSPWTNNGPTAGLLRLTAGWLASEWTGLTPEEIVSELTAGGVISIINAPNGTGGPMLPPGGTTTPVPLPASVLLMLGGFGGLAALRRRKKIAGAKVALA